MNNEKIKIKYRAYLPQIAATFWRKLNSKELEIRTGLTKKEPCCELEHRKGLWEGLHSSSDDYASSTKKRKRQQYLPITLLRFRSDLKLSTDIKGV